MLAFSSQNSLQVLLCLQVEVQTSAVVLEQVQVVLDLGQRCCLGAEGVPDLALVWTMGEEEMPGSEHM